MDILECVHLKLKYCSFIWRRVQLRLSYEYHWTKHNEVVVLSITRNRHRSLSLKVDCVLLDQILLDSSTHLLPPSSRELQRLRFRLQNGEKIFNFQAPDEVAYEMWRVAIVDAISETAEMEQKCQTASIIDIDVEKIEKDGDVLMRQLDHDQARVYVRDATNFKLIRLHQPAASIVTAEQTLDDIQHDITTAKTKSEVVDVDTMVSEDVTAFNPLFDGHFGHLVDAVDHQHKFPDNSKTTGSNVSSHTATSSEDCDCEPSSASTATHTSSDSGDEILDLFTPMKTMKTEAYLHTMFSTSAVRLRNPTARETLRRRLMETDAKKHGMFPSHPIFKQPEEELDGLFDTRYTVHPY